MNPAWRSMTALASADGRVATKTHRWTGDGWDTSGYSAGYMFRHWTRVLDGLDDLAGGLEKLAAQPDIFVIRGNVKPDAPHKIQRTYKADGAWIEDADKCWLCIDIDGQPASPDRDHVEQAIALMPDWLQDADCVWRFSSSHGVKPSNQLRLHLWYWLTRPVGNNALRAWARPLPIDGALYQPVQPHYTASPIFIGADDPVARRIGYHRSSSRAANPPMELLPSDGFALWQQREAEARAKERMARETMRPPTRSTSWDEDKRYKRIVEQELERLRTAGEGNRHASIYAVSKAVGSLAHASTVTATARADIEETARAIMPANRQDEAARRVAEGWGDGTSAPRELKPSQTEQDDKAFWGEGKPSFLDWRNFQ